MRTALSGGAAAAEALLRVALQQLRDEVARGLGQRLGVLDRLLRNAIDTDDKGMVEMRETWARGNEQQPLRRHVSGRKREVAQAHKPQSSREQEKKRRRTTDRQTTSRKVAGIDAPP